MGKVIELTLKGGLLGKYGPKILIELFSPEGVGFDPQKNYVNLRLYKYFNYWALSWQSMSSIVHNLENSISIQKENVPLTYLYVANQATIAWSNRQYKEISYGATNGPPSRI